MLDARAEGDDAALARRRVHTPDPALSPDDEAGSVGQPGVLRVDAVDGPGFLQILVERGKQAPLLARGERAQHELAARAEAADEGERPAVGRDARGHCAAWARRDGPLSPGPQVARDDRVDHAVGVLVVLEVRAGRDVLAVVQRLAIGRDGWLAGVLLDARPRGDLQAF